MDDMGAYEAGLEDRLPISQPVHRGAIGAVHREGYIEKGDGRKRPLDRLTGRQGRQARGVHPHNIYEETSSAFVCFRPGRTSIRRWMLVLRVVKRKVNYY